MRQKSRLSFILMLGLVSSIWAASANAAQPCEIEYVESEVWQGYRFHCNLADLLKNEFSAVYAGEFNEVIVALKLPDLNIINLSITPYWSQVEVSAEIENQGLGDARAFDVIGSAQVMVPGTSTPIAVEDPMTGNNETTQIRFGASAGIPAGQTEHVFVGTFELPDRSQAYDFVVTVVADPATAQSPGGSLWEQNEMNNGRMETETIFP